jgi:UDP-2-acetamido-3-amino-2,3-dideoxy-glucuronate N-acetyltransferase
MIDEPVAIGEHTQVQPFTRIQGHTIIGSYTEIGPNVSIGHAVMIGDHVTIEQNVVLDTGTIIENAVQCAANVVIAAKSAIRAQQERLPSLVKPTLIKQGSCIGPNTTIAKGIRIGRYTFVEAGSVADADVQDYQVVMGNPIQLIAWRCVCGHLLLNQPELPTPVTRFECQACGQGFVKTHPQRLQPQGRPHAIPLHG